MCIITIKEIGKDLPKDEILQQMFSYNDDGAGYAFNRNGEVIIRKGFMNYASLKQSLDTVEDIKEVGMLLHFRITTNGGTVPSNTHPFPISDKLSVISRLRTKTDVAMVHNGIISSVGGWSKKYSDTMEFVMEQVSIIKEMNPLFYKDELALKLLYRLADSKLAFIDGEGHISYVGEFIEDNGILYSNTSYKGYRSNNSSHLWSGSGYTNYDYTYSSDKSRFCKFLDSSHWVLNANGDVVDNAYFEIVMDVYGQLYKLDYSSDNASEKIKPIYGHEVFYKLNNGSVMETTFTSISSPGEWLELVKTQDEIDVEEITKLFLANGADETDVNPIVDVQEDYLKE